MMIDDHDFAFKNSCLHIGTLSGIESNMMYEVSYENKPRQLKQIYYAFHIRD